MNGGQARDIGAYRWLVWGLGRLGGGVGVARFLASQGAKLTVADRAEPETLRESIAALSDMPITFRLGREDPSVLDDVDAVVVNPAVVKPASPLFGEIVRRGLAWTTEINLFLARCQAPVIGVTGSYGKSTTCAMLAAILQASSRATGVPRTVHLGGNIGGSLLGDLERIDTRDQVVLELSSAQLEDLPRIAVAPHIAVITNLHHHHLDRHGSFEAYVQAKLNILGSRTTAVDLVLGPELSWPDSAHAVQAADLLARRIAGSGVRVHRTRPPPDPFDLRVGGAHNQINAQVAIIAAMLAGVSEDVARQALAAFDGLPHRLQWIRCLDHVDYVNDSKATSPSGTRTALLSQERPVIAIVGGAAIDEPVEDCARLLVERCRAVACLGATGLRFAEALRTLSGRDGRPALLETGDLEEAVSWARRQAVEGDVVLFSPGATSFDRYANFEARGAHFMSIVNRLT